MRKLSTFIGASALAIAVASFASVSQAAPVQGFDQAVQAQAAPTPAQRMIRGDGPRGFDNISVTSIDYLRANGKDDQYVSLVGRLTSYLGDDNYEFTDNTGTVVVELDDDRSWHHIKKDQLIQIYGKLDKDWDNLKIEVKKAHPARPMPR